MNFFSRFFRDGQQARLFWALAAASLFDCALIAYRIFMKKHDLPLPETVGEIAAMRSANLSFLFLFWNLFLAWIPYLTALRFSHHAAKTTTNWLKISALLFIWFSFLPNAPYILTDLVHLKPRPPIPFWLDLVLLFSTAFTGLMLGLVSLFEIQISVRRWLSPRTIWLLTFPVLSLCGFGVWLGRFQRWNSWDILTRPDDIFRDLVLTLSQRQEFLQAFKISALLTVFLMVGYAMFLAIVGQRQPQQ